MALQFIHVLSIGFVLFPLVPDVFPHAVLMQPYWISFTSPKTPMIAGGIMSMEVACFQIAGFMSGPNGLSLNQDF
jgi:hypothetical protein